MPLLRDQQMVLAKRGWKWKSLIKTCDKLGVQSPFPMTTIMEIQLIQNLIHNTLIHYEFMNLPSPLAVAK